MLDRVARQDEDVPAQDVVDVRALLGPHVDADQVGGRALEGAVDLGPADEEHRRPTQPGQPPGQFRGLAAGAVQAVDYHQIAVDMLARQGRLQSAAATLLPQTVGLFATPTPPKVAAAPNLEHKTD